MTGVLLARAAGEDPFSDRDEGTLHDLLPTLAAAVRRSDRVSAALEKRSALEAVAASSVRRPLVAFSARGALRWISPLAEALLGPTGALPPALAAEARRLGALARGSPEGPLPASGRAFSLPGGGRVRAELSIARAAGGEVVVLAELSAAGPAAEPPPLLPARRECLDPLAREHGLTPAEVDVLAVLATGLTNREIAARLFVSVETVRTHVARILRKTGASTRAQAAVMARARMG
jgi:DNA-binding CsgD family transcriptional regulator